MFLYGMCVNPFRNDPRDHWEGLVAVVVHAAIGAALWIFGGWEAWVLVQVVPHFLMGVAGAYFFYAQHNFPGVSFCDSAGWTYEKAALESSSYLRTSRLMAWFSGNIGYHHIHHLNARIPFYRLPEVFRKMPELQAPKETTLWPRDIIRCLRLKVWDVEKQQMVDVRGL
jgi:omega-6 fatty acid desaturase (delta-12 desaturase)